MRVPECCHTIEAFSLKMKNEDPKYATHATTTSASAFMNIFLIVQLSAIVARRECDRSPIICILFFYAPSQYWCARNVHCFHAAPNCSTFNTLVIYIVYTEKTMEKRPSPYIHISRTHVPPRSVHIGQHSYMETVHASTIMSFSFDHNHH